MVRTGSAPLREEMASLRARLDITPPQVPARMVARQPSAETRCSGATLAAREDSKLPWAILHYASRKPVR